MEIVFLLFIIIFPLVETSVIYHNFQLVSKRWLYILLCNSISSDRPFEKLVGDDSKLKKFK